MQTTDTKAMQQLAEHGDVKAQLEMGKLCLAQEKYDNAAAWLRRAAEKESIEAQYIFGSLLSQGLGVDQDHEAAAFWLRQAAESGHSGAQVLLGETFESGNGVPINHGMAARWFLRAAEQGDPVAQMKYGQLLRKGHGLEKNLAEARRWLETSLNNGHAEAAEELVACLLEMPDASFNDILNHARTAAGSGTARGQFLLASIFEKAPPELQDLTAIEKLYRVAGEKGSTEAQMRLAQLYAEGRIVAKNPAEAERWLNLAVGNSAAAEGTSEDKAQAPSAVQSSAAAPGFLPGVSGSLILHDYPPGTIIGSKYFIISQLGKGGMCRVYKAKHLSMNRTVALKMMLPELSTNEKLVRRFHREAQAASSINHPNVITIYDLGTSPCGKPYIVMDFLDGESLEDRIDAIHMMSTQEFLHIFIQVCAGLEAAHDVGLIHRDIKPSNIMVVRGKNGQDIVKVVDFGLAKSLDPGEDDQKLTKTGEVFGTLSSMSPEQCLGHPLDARTDIYSLGCTMYEALTFSPIHSANSPFELMSKHINNDPQPMRIINPALTIPDQLERIILKALARNRDERYQNVGDLKRELEALR